MRFSLKESNKPVEAYFLCQELLDYKDCSSILEELELSILNQAQSLYLAGDANAAAQLLFDCGIDVPVYDYVASGDYALAVGGGLANIIIPNGVTEIGSSAFKGCTGLTSLTIPRSVTEIGDYAFEGCTGLTSLTIPSSVTEIGNRPFYGCSSLRYINFDGSYYEWKKLAAFYVAYDGCGRIAVNCTDRTIEWYNY